MSGTVYRLADAQRDAVDPTQSVWLSASAGTGKTQVLSARVLRLLLQDGVAPSSVLCLTFTKAGAAEMAVRVNQVLARWVRLDDANLGKELAWLGADVSLEMRNRARSLFASVLDCPGGGLRIDTIHAFAQYLLSAFPIEAGMAPGVRPMEDRERDLLSRRVLSTMLEAGDETFVRAVEDLSERKGPDAVRPWLMRCAQYSELWTGATGWQPPVMTRVLRLLGLPADADEAWLSLMCDDDRFPVESLRAMLPALKEWPAKSGQESHAFVTDWLSLDATERLNRLDGFLEANRPLKKDGEPRVMAGAAKIDPSFPEHQRVLADAVTSIQGARTALELASYVAPQLEAGRAFALRWSEAKEREGVVDFDDLIARAAALLSDGEVAGWIRYKLDRSFDHILVDEAQDTNMAQWHIIKALTDDYFDGLGAAGTTLRTIFTVGDYKQAIFGFQGTSPENFRSARDHFRDRIRTNASLRDARADMPVYDLQEYALDQSYRTSEVILDFVDAAISQVGHEGLGVENSERHHLGQDRPGRVVLWNPVKGREEDPASDEASGTQDWLARHDRRLADNIARQISRWMRDGYTLHKDGERRAKAGDIMVLVQKRRELASLIVARLHSHGIPVAGVDRLRLGNPLVVKDLMAALRFAAQPLDDLTLACLLVSPLLGWSQDDLLVHGYRAKDVRLWDHLQRRSDPRVVATVGTLKNILARADFDTPQELLRWILTGDMDGRRKLVARLGSEANDPIDELLNAAHTFSATQTASLHGFIRWFDAGDGELKRETNAAANEVRVMTVHGAKGLQAPIVILADATIAPDLSSELVLVDHEAGDLPVPMPPLASAEKPPLFEPLDAAAKARALAEHWRLFYVAMTRAEEGLYIGGSLNTTDRRRGEPHEDSWYARVRSLFDGEAEADDIWGGAWHRGDPVVPIEIPTDPGSETDRAAPAWLFRPVAAEARPPRPLAPSRAGQYEGSNPPLAATGLAEAAVRGTVLHALLERLPSIVADKRRAVAMSWLSRNQPDWTEDENDAIVEEVMAVLSDPEFTDVFSVDGMAEVPLTAVVNGQVISGVVDRLLITDDTVTVVDFKTAKRPPASASDIPDAVYRQMAAYVAALRTIYPGHQVRAAVLYTQTPRLFELPPSSLETHEGALETGEESVGQPAIAD